MNEDLFHLVATAGYEYYISRSRVADLRSRCKNGTIVNGAIAAMKAREIAYKDALDSYFKKVAVDMQTVGGLV